MSGSDDVQREALARLTWAVLADTSVPVEERAANAVEVIDAYSAAVAVPTLHEVLSTRVDLLPDVNPVLRSLQEACEVAARNLPSWPGHRLADLSIELVVSLDGVDALGPLARDPTFPHDDRVRRAWLDELTSSGRITDAIDVATSEHARIPASYARADLADRLAGLCRSTGDRSGAARADLAAFGDHPTLTRLARLCDDAGGDIRSFSAQLEAGREATHDQVRVAIDVLTGNLDRLAEPWPTTDWRSEIDDVVLAVGALLIASRPSSDATATRLAAALVATVDLHPRRHELLLAARAGGEHPRLAPFLLAAIEAEPPDPARATTASALVDQAAEIVLSGKIRHRYDTIARLVVALAHTRSALDVCQADETIGAYEQRYKRFSAFRSALGTATEEARAAGADAPTERP